MENKRKKKSGVFEKALYVGLGMLLYRGVITPLYDLIVDTYFR